MQGLYNAAYFGSRLLGTIEQQVLEQVGEAGPFRAARHASRHDTRCRRGRRGMVLSWLASTRSPLARVIFSYLMTVDAWASAVSGASFAPVVCTADKAKARQQRSRQFH